MIVSKPKNIGRQQPLWSWVDDVKFHSLAQTRTYVGDFCEEATLSLLGKHVNPRRLKTDATSDICPDILADRYPEPKYFEVKSVGLHKCSLLYEHVVTRQKEFASGHHHALYYCYWRHALRVKGIETLHDLRTELARKMVSVVIIPFWSVLAHVEKKSTLVMNYKARKRDGTKDSMAGWRVPAAFLKKLSAGQARMRCDLRAYDIALPCISVHDPYGVLVYE